MTSVIFSTPVVSWWTLSWSLAEGSGSRWQGPVVPGSWHLPGTYGPWRLILLYDESWFDIEIDIRIILMSYDKLWLIINFCHRHSIFHTSIIVLEVSASPMMPICPARPTAGRSWGSNSNTSGSGVFRGFVEVDGVENLVDIQHDSEMNIKIAEVILNSLH